LAFLFILFFIWIGSKLGVSLHRILKEPKFMLCNINLDLETNPYLEQNAVKEFTFGECIFKKCCKKYKEGKRCKKCPNR
jgi:hypothetical protein